MVQYILLFLVNTPLCDWHDFGGHAGSPDPETQAIVDASAVALVVILLGGVFMFLVGGPLILVLTHKVRHLFWSIPAVNITLYIAAIIARPFPGGVGARFRMPGLLHTALELFFLIVVSLGAAIVLAAVCLIYRATKMAAKTLASSGRPAGVEESGTRAISEE